MCDTLYDKLATLERMVENRLRWAENAEETFTVLKPEYDKWETARITDAEPTKVNIYVVRLAIDHRLEGRRHRKEIEAIEAAIEALRQQEANR